MQFPVIKHGSENSLDEDIYVVIPQPVSFKEAKTICDSYKPKNANVLVITDGIVTWNFKGTIDECNNSILQTYSLHQQNYQLPITRPVKRFYGLKMLRTIRGILSYCSRTEHREQVKKALKNTYVFDKIQALSKIDITKIQDYEKTSIIETYKFFAFQLGQTLALLEHNKELFTKNSVAEFYPDLRPALQRIPSDPAVLQFYLNKFIAICQKETKHVDKQPTLFRTDFFGHKEIIKTLEEVVLPPVVVFDLDGTLYNESHRAEYREKLDWETYFSLCDKDTLIESVANILRDYAKKGYEIWIASGRSEPICLEKTIACLQRDQLPFHGIKLRGQDNFVPDYALKPAWMAKYIGLDRIEAVYDDTDAVIEGFRKKGLFVVDVKTLNK